MPVKRVTKHLARQNSSLRQLQMAGDRVHASAPNFGTRSRREGSSSADRGAERRALRPKQAELSGRWRLRGAIERKPKAKV